MPLAIIVPENEVIISDRLNRKEAAAYLTKIGFPISASHLANMAVANNAGAGPPFYKTNWRTSYYRREDLILWASDRIKRVE